jgi:hypothetical protein
MASGHANRTNRPNTWPHRPSLRREESPCQLGAVHTWHDPEAFGRPNKFCLLRCCGLDVFSLIWSLHDPTETLAGKFTVMHNWRRSRM